jgi:hypothetical protein
LSSDGQAQILGIKGTFPLGEFYALQNVDSFPPPPPWTTVVGQAYRLVKSTGAPSIAGSSFVVNYLSSEVSPGEEPFLTIYFYPTGGTGWQALPTSCATGDALVSAPMQTSDGLYILLSSIETPLTPGWNIVPYPVQGSRAVSEALASIAGQYSHVCGYFATEADPWHCFDPGAPSWASDLSALEFGSYWINLTATQAVTLYLKGPFGAAGQQLDRETGLQLPLAIYYGQVLAGQGFTPVDGMTVEAIIDGQPCGQATVKKFDGLLTYAIDVWATDVSGGSVCGETVRSCRAGESPACVAGARRRAR